MATLAFSYDTGSVPLSKIIGAFAETYNYQATIQDPNDPTGIATIPNPESQANFARRMVKNYIVDIVRSQDTATAVQTATSTVVPIVLV